MEGSIRKRSKPQTERNLVISVIENERVINPKAEVIRKMHLKVKEKYRKTFPKLKGNELKVLSAIVLIQRLWRQKKVKDMIGEFLSPRSFNMSHNATFGRNSLQEMIKDAE